MGSTMRRKRSPTSLSSVVQLLGLASTTSALSLANFQVITSSAIPTSCIVAYNSPIEGCATRDFTNGNQCSATCVNGLAETQSNVLSICDGLNVNPQSLLGLTLLGQLLDTLCPGSTTTTTVRVTVRPSTTIPSFTTTSRLITTTPVIFTSARTTTASTAIASTATVSAPPISTTIVNTVPTTTTEPLPASTQQQTSQTTTAQTTATAFQTTQATNGQQNTSPTSQDISRPTTGGGSPFDTVIQNGAPGLTTIRSTGATLVAVGVVLVLL
jgi:hypothetical protein